MVACWKPDLLSRIQCTEANGTLVQIFVTCLPFLFRSGLVSCALYPHMLGNMLHATA